MYQWRVLGLICIEDIPNETGIVSFLKEPLSSIYLYVSNLFLLPLYFLMHIYDIHNMALNHI